MKVLLPGLMMGRLVSRVRRLSQKTDFKRNPLRATWRRVHWHIRWRITSTPWPLEMADGLTLYVPKTGAGALVFFHGVSEPNVVQFVRRFLVRGMTFIDVGAHAGEFSLVAGTCVGSSGHVHAFEPNPSLACLVAENVKKNGLSHVVTHCAAIGNVDGAAQFEVTVEPSLGHLRTDNQSVHELSDTQMTVTSMQLDTLVSSLNLTPDLIKVDVEGAELLVLEGSQALLSLSAHQAPAWIIEWAPRNWKAFGYSADDLLQVLKMHGYHVCTYSSSQGLRVVDPFHDEIEGNLTDGNILALKNPGKWQ